MERRGFLGALAAMLVARKITLPSEHTQRVTATEIVERWKTMNRVSTVRTGLPPLAWRRLNDGPAIQKILRQQNEILNDLPWKEE